MSCILDVDHTEGKTSGIDMRDIDEEVETMSLGGSELYPVRVGGHIRWGDYYEDSVEGLVEISRYSGLGCFVGKMVTRRGLIYRK